MAPPGPPVSGSGSDRGSKRKRGMHRDVSVERSRRRRATGIEGDSPDLDDYDPDQDVEERRQLRKGLRDLSKNLIDNRAEFLNPTSTGLLDTLRKANEFSAAVRQTADATIDSRLLVNTADMSYRKTLAMTSGDTSQGVDVDEFVSKCINFMRRADGAVRDGPQAPSSAQRRRGRANVGEDLEGEGDEGDMLNWEHLGRFACLPNNSRPSVPGFLLGPLSLEKRTRRPMQRKAGLRLNNLTETRPEVLKPGDIEKTENANLTVLCTRILGRLKKVARDVQIAVEAESREDMSDAEVKALMDKHGINPDGGIALFKFVVNPYSFGQTVENLFYVSFLIRDGKVGITIDDDGLPFLGLSSTFPEPPGVTDTLAPRVYSA
jgi:hypothetical protein